MKKDYILECGTDICDGGIGCKLRARPTLKQCQRCMCAECTRGKCQQPGDSNANSKKS